MLDTDLYKFFTGWLVLAAVFKHIFDPHIDLFFLACVVFAVGVYISFVAPRRYTFRFLGKQYVVAGWTRFFVVDAIHLGLVVFLFPRRGIFSATRFLNACLLLFIYYATILDIYGESVYMVDKTTLTTIVLITTYFYLILMRKNVSH
jgi:hypothetical protein